MAPATSSKNADLLPGHSWSTSTAKRPSPPDHRAGRSSWERTHSSGSGETAARSSEQGGRQSVGAWRQADAVDQAAEVDLVAITKDACVGHPVTVDEGAVFGLEVADHEAPVRLGELAVSP